MQSHRAVFLNTAALFAVQARTERDVMLTALPLPHVYGSAGTSNCSYMPNVHGSIGYALPGVEARVAALDGASVTVPDGESGELMIRGPLVMAGYLPSA
jgi:long-subunit acyl-CoA synthetase (AMP-forming)